MKDSVMGVLVEIKSIMIVGHLIGLILGLGSATVADILFLRSILNNRISREQFQTLKSLTNLVVIGLLLLGATGFGFIYINFTTNFQLNMNPKMWAKVSIIILLSFNGLVLHDLVLPMLQRNVDRPLFSIAEIIRSRVLMFSCGAISFCSWYAALILGVWKEANFKYSYTEIMGFYFFLIAVAVLGCVFISSIVTRLAQTISPDSVQDFQNAKIIPSANLNESESLTTALLNKELSRSRRAGRSLALVSLRIDHPDILAGAMGSALPHDLEQAVVQRIYAGMRSYDHLLRTGRGAYICIVADADEIGASKTLRRISQQLEGYEIPTDAVLTEVRPIKLKFSTELVLAAPYSDISALDLVRQMESQNLKCNRNVHSLEEAILKRDSAVPRQRRNFAQQMSKS